MEDLSDPNLRLSSYDFARQMNIQRTMLMRAYLRGVGSAIAAGVRGFARVCVRFRKASSRLAASATGHPRAAET